MSALGRVPGTRMTGWRIDAMTAADRYEASDVDAQRTLLTAATDDGPCGDGCRLEQCHEGPCDEPSGATPW